MATDAATRRRRYTVLPTSRNASDPDEMARIAEPWNELYEATQRKLLPTILCRVVWHHADQEITLDLMDDAAERIANASESE